MEIAVEPASQPAWQFTPLAGSAAVVSSHPSGRWTIVRGGGSIEGASLDEVLCSAVRDDAAQRRRSHRRAARHGSRTP